MLSLVTIREPTGNKVKPLSTPFVGAVKETTVKNNTRWLAEVGHPKTKSAILAERS